MTVERTCREMNYSFQQRYEFRQEKSIPVLKELHPWLKENMTAGNPKSPIRTGYQLFFATMG